MKIHSATHQETGTSFAKVARAGVEGCVEILIGLKFRWGYGRSAGPKISAKMILAGEAGIIPRHSLIKFADRIHC